MKSYLTLGDIVKVRWSNGEHTYTEDVVIVYASCQAIGPMSRGNRIHIGSLGISKGESGPIWLTIKHEDDTHRILTSRLYEGYEGEVLEKVN